MRPLIGITGRKDTSARLHNAPMISVGETYIRAIHRAGGTPVILPPVTGPMDWAVLLERIDGLLLSGGEDVEPQHYGEQPSEWLGGVDAERDTAELGLIGLVMRRKMPILAICRGHQLFNVALGGTLYQDIAAQIPGALLDHPLTPGRTLRDLTHPVTLAPESRLASILGGTEFMVNSGHHQAVRELGRGLVAVAHAPDGVIEAVELPDYPFAIGIQWHPEAMVMDDAVMMPIFEEFVAACRRS